MKDIKTKLLTKNYKTMNELIEQFEIEQAKLNTDISDTINTIKKSLTPFSNKEAHEKIRRIIERMK
jgi:hypothetical protein